MSLRRNILANYASQLYVTAAGIVMVPLYIKYMGAEAYGLVGFFAMLQAWFNLLDMGLTPTMARESARFNGGAISVLDYRRLARALEGVFAGVALLGGVLLFALARPIAGQWLNASQLPLNDITGALKIMAIIIALRWMCGLYRGVITGAERLVWLSGFNSLIATGRFVLILPVLMYVNASPLAFFSFQLGMAVLEFAGLAGMAYRLLPPVPAGQRIRWEWAPLKPVLKFSLSIAFTSSIWVLVTQTDKLLLSKILPLADYGYFTVAVMVASGISAVSSPISAAIIPRLTRLNSEGRQEDLLAIYRNTTRVIALISIPVASILCFFSYSVLYTWTGDALLANQTSQILALYAAGNSILVIAAMPSYLQYAKGDLKLHVIGNIFFLTIIVPASALLTIFFGGFGGGIAWLLANIAYFLLWTPIVHNKFIPGKHMQWIKKDILEMSIPPLATAFFCWLLSPISTNRLEALIHLFLFGFAALLSSATVFYYKNQKKIPR